MSIEFNLCPICGGVKSHPMISGHVHPGAFKMCTCPKPEVTVTMVKPLESKPVPIEAEIEHLGVKYRSTLYPVED